MEETLRALAGPLVEGMGIELVDALYTTESGRRIVRLLIDKPGGVTVDDCSRVSREFGTFLDVEDPVQGSYSLEVSSPGLDRPLLKEGDFLRAVGLKVRIRTKLPIEGRKNFKATIDGIEGGMVALTDTEGRRLEIELSNIDRARCEAVI
ncbi:MAG: ribosome maturation factor RimP [Thermodesulfobacteriota bacterium]